MHSQILGGINVHPFLSIGMDHTAFCHRGDPLEHSLVRVWPTVIISYDLKHTDIDNSMALGASQDGPAAPEVLRKLTLHHRDGEFTHLAFQDDTVFHEDVDFCPRRSESCRRRRTG